MTLIVRRDINTDFGVLQIGAYTDPARIEIAEVYRATG